MTVLKGPRLSKQTLAVLDVFVTSNEPELAGSDIARTTNLRSGVLYPILNRLEGVGWLDSRWEEGNPRLLQRPLRRYYRMTAYGVESMAKAIEARREK